MLQFFQLEMFRVRGAEILKFFWSNFSFPTRLHSCVLHSNILHFMKNHSRAFQIKNLIKRNLGKLPYWGTIKFRSRPQLPTSGNHRAKASSREVRRLQIKKIHESQTGQEYRWKLIKFSSRSGKCGLQCLCWVYAGGDLFPLIIFIAFASDGARARRREYLFNIFLYSLNCTVRSLGFVRIISNVSKALTLPLSWHSTVEFGTYRKLKAEMSSEHLMNFSLSNDFRLLSRNDFSFLFCFKAFDDEMDGKSSSLWAFWLNLVEAGKSGTREEKDINLIKITILSWLRVEEADNFQ